MPSKQKSTRKKAQSGPTKSTTKTAAYEAYMNQTSETDLTPETRISMEHLMKPVDTLEEKWKLLPSFLKVRVHPLPSKL